MKNFSEAIRDGSKLNKQCTKGWQEVQDGKLTTCAAIAGMVDLGFIKDNGDGTYEYQNLEEVGLKFDQRTGQKTLQYKVPDFLTDLLHNVDQECPCEHKELLKGSIVLTMITHLNDYHKWSREAIAEWVEVIEKKIGIFREEKKEETKTEVVSAPVVTGDCVECGKKD